MQESLNADAAQVEADAGCPNEPIDIDDVVRDAENAPDRPSRSAVRRAWSSSAAIRRRGCAR